MNQRSAFRSFSAVLLTAGLVVASGGASVFAFQEQHPANVEGAKPKDSTAGQKADASDKTTPAPGVAGPAPEKGWGPYQVVSSIEFGIRGIGISGNGNKFRSDHNYDPGFRLFDASLDRKSVV